MGRSVLLLVVAACASKPKQVEFDLASPPDFFVYREGSSTWASPSQPSSGVYRFDAIDDFEVVAVYVHSDGFVAQNLNATVADGIRWTAVDAITDRATVWFPEFPPDTCLDLPRASTKVTGTMSQAGHVSMGKWCTSSLSAPWTFSLDVPAGGDLVATDAFVSEGGPNAARILISRQQASPSNVGLDLASGTAMVAEPITVMGADGPFVTTTTLTTTTTSAMIAQDNGEQAHVAPASVLLGPDVQIIRVDSPSPDSATDQAAMALVGDQMPAFDLLPPVEATFSTAANVDVAAWTSLSPRVEFAWLRVVGFPSNGFTQEQNVTATAAWLTKHGATSVAFDTSAPGYDATWFVDRTNQPLREFRLGRIDQGVSYMRFIRP